MQAEGQKGDFKKEAESRNNALRADSTSDLSKVRYSKVGRALGGSVTGDTPMTASPSRQSGPAILRNGDRENRRDQQAQAGAGRATRGRRARPILAAKRVWGWTSQRASANQLQAARPCRLLSRPKRPSITSAILTTDRNSWCKSPGSLKSTPLRPSRPPRGRPQLAHNHPSIHCPCLCGPQNRREYTWDKTQAPRDREPRTGKGPKSHGSLGGSGVRGPAKQAWTGYQSVPGVGGRPSEGRKKFYRPSAHQYRACTRAQGLRVLRAGTVLDQSWRVAANQDVCAIWVLWVFAGALLHPLSSPCP